MRSHYQDRFTFASGWASAGIGCWLLGVTPTPAGLIFGGVIVFVFGSLGEYAWSWMRQFTVVRKEKQP